MHETMPGSYSGNILSLVREGMPVEDANGHQVGEVEDLYLGETSQSEEEMGKGAATGSPLDLTPDDTLVEDIAEGLADGEELPDVLRERLRREGFIQVEGDGLFGQDRYILPDQIDAVRNGRVILNVPYDDLITS